MLATITNVSACVLMMSILLSSCGPGLFIDPTLTPIPTPTSTSTLTPTPDPTTTPTEKPFSYPEWSVSESTRLAEKYGFTSWDELVNNFEMTLAEKHKGEIGGWFTVDEYPYDDMIQNGWVLDVASIPVTTDYYKNLGIKNAVVLEVAFEDSQAMTPVLAGYEMSDGNYEATLPLEVGPVQADWSQDVKLMSRDSLNKYVGGIWGIKAVRSLSLNSRGKTPDQIISEWDVTTYDTNVFRFKDIMTSRASLLFKKSLVNPNGYSDYSTGYYSVLGNHILRENLANGTPFSALTDYLLYAGEPDSWVLGEILCSDFNGNALMFR